MKRALVAMDRYSIEVGKTYKIDETWSPNFGGKIAKVLRPTSRRSIENYTCVMVEIGQEEVPVPVPIIALQKI